MYTRIEGLKCTYWAPNEHPRLSSRRGEMIGTKIFNEGIHTWRIRISTNSLKGGILGIISKSNPSQFTNTSIHIGINIPDGTPSITDGSLLTNNKIGNNISFNKSLKENDIITIIVNMDDKSMKIYINDKNKGYIFNSGCIKKGKYSFCAIMYAHDTTYQML